MSQISKQLKEHYATSFQKFGPTAQGVDWGDDNTKLLLRYKNMHNVILLDRNRTKDISILDVGCGFSGFYGYLKGKEAKINYSGIDLVDTMVTYARDLYPYNTYICADFLNYRFENHLYDYVVCNGILTQKLSSSILDMDKYAKKIIKKMFFLCRRGIAFNIMTSKVNFMVSNLYYKSPLEMLSYCFSEISSNFIIDHSYPLFEYTVYLYK